VPDLQTGHRDDRTVVPSLEAWVETVPVPAPGSPRPSGFRGSSHGTPADRILGPCGWSRFRLGPASRPLRRRRWWPPVPRGHPPGL